MSIHEHPFYDRDGKPISLEDWGREMEADRVDHEDASTDGITIKTVYLGFVCAAIEDARLFGTAFFRDNRFVCQVEVYDSKQDAYQGHLLHLDARDNGFHCHRCRTGDQHD